MSDVLPTIHNTLGVLYVVSLITSALYGTGMLQGWLYFRRYLSRDHWAISSLVGFVLLCDTIQQILICHSVYLYAVSNHGDPLAMTKMHNTIIIELFFGGAVALSVQGFYCWRIWTLSHNIFVTAFIALVAIAAAVSIWAYSAITLGYTSLGELILQKDFATALNVLNAAADILITLAMIGFLQRSKTGFRKTTDVLNRMIIFTFNTGIPTTICAILDVITLNALPNTFIYMGFYLTMDRFYTNSLLVTLNSRAYIRDAKNGTETESISLGSRGAISAPNYAPHLASVNNSTINRMQDPNSISIRIEKQTVNDEDVKNYGYYKQADQV